VIERLISTIGSPQIAIDDRHTPKLYSRFLASLLAKHKRDGAAQGRMHQQGPPTQQLQTGSSAPVYQQPQQPQPTQSHSGGSNSFAAGVSGGAGAPDMGQSVALNSGVTARNEMTDAAVSVSADGNGTGNYVLGHSADFTFGGQDQHADLMDFTFDPITTHGSEDMLAAMQAIQNPTWWHTMMMPGSVECVILCVILVRLIFVSRPRPCRFVWPAEESMQDHIGSLGSGMAVNNYQNVQPLPAEVLLS
jgi:hypothetical protein